MAGSTRLQQGLCGTSLRLSFLEERLWQRVCPAVQLSVTLRGIAQTTITVAHALRLHELCAEVLVDGCRSFALYYIDDLWRLVTRLVTR